VLRALITTDVLLACFYIPGLLAIVSVVSSIPCSLGVRQMALTMDGWMDGWMDGFVCITIGAPCTLQFALSLSMHIGFIWRSV